VAQHLVQRYKFKYLSAMELVRFEESAGSPESIEIRKALEEKAELSSGLIIRVLQKVMVLYGPRKYLIDSFPRSLADVTDF
jgi:adenylate kinase family enzyme